jgi:hypothetical protein
MTWPVKPERDTRMKLREVFRPFNAEPVRFF